ncbi:MAG: 1-acyl-sn-glycerol-3-phosphate acyltransferase [Acidimicrobiia bacterium]
MRLWPRWLRRIVLGPAVVLATVAMASTLPGWALIAAFASRYVPGRWRPLRLLWFLLVWLVLESLVLVELLALWVASGFGWKLRTRRFEDYHYLLMGWFLGRAVASARRTFGLDIAYEDARPTDFDGVPVLVFCRHAGPGDSILLVEALVNRFDRRPRIVLKDTLQWDPAIDILLSRLPSRFIESRGRPGEAATRAIGHLAATMGHDDALVIFPEGGNYTEGRWKRAIHKLETGGLTHHAARARTMLHVLPPKPGGVAAAIAAAPNAGIALVGHTGTEEMDSLADIWHGLKMDLSIATRVWRYPASAVPLDRPGLETWLYDRWAEMNEWIGTTQNAERRRPNARIRRRPRLDQ